MTTAHLSGDRQVNLILVEDDEIDALALRRAFERQAVESPLLHIKDGPRALQLLRDLPDELAHSPRVLILDLNMPQMSGLELLQEIREDKALRSTVVFVLTTSTDDRDRQAAYALNVAGYLVKDGHQESLLGVADLFKSYCEQVSLCA